MAGLLKSIVKRLSNGSSTKVSTVTRPSKKTSSNKAIKVKPVASVANEWVKNSTISDPVIIKPVEVESKVVEELLVEDAQIDLTQSDTEEMVLTEEKTTEEVVSAEEKTAEEVVSAEEKTTEEVVSVEEIITEEVVSIQEEQAVSASETTAIDRTMKRERTNKDVEREDYLLTQIDEFREKAQQLQNLLLTKESKVMELQHIVDEREVKAKELEAILNERQRKADGMTAEVAKQIDALIEKVTEKMDEIGVSIGNEVADGQKISIEQMESLKETLASVNEQLETIKGELSDKIHTENVKCFRNISDLFKSMDEKVYAIQKKEADVEFEVKAVQKGIKTLTVLTIINMIGLALVLLMELGVFQLFM